MPSAGGVKQRLRLIRAALTAPSARLPVPIENSTYYDAVRVAGDGYGVPTAWGDLFAVLGADVTGNSAEDSLEPADKFALLTRGPETKSASEPDVARLIYRLIRRLRPDCVIEVGVFRGAASCHIAEALRQNGTASTFHLVDMSQSFIDITRAKLAEFGLLDRAAFHCGDAVAIAVELPQAGLVYLDADRSDEGVQRHFDAFWPRVAPGGFLVLHDTILWNGARSQGNRLAQRFPRVVMTLATSGGSGVTIVRKDEPSRG